MIEKRLIDISKNISSGITPLRSNDEFWTDGTIPWLKTEQLGEKYIFDTNEYITEKALQEANVKIFPENTLSIAMYGEGKTRGNVSILKRPMATNQACCNIELDEEKVSSEYVYYFLKTQYENLRGLSSGIRKNLNTNDIKNFVVRLPENLKTQQSIAAVLSALDKKIALNKQINARLEEMAKTLYDYWFVQFDFPDANGKPYKSSGGEMVFDETLKREIPKGWEVKSLGEIATLKAGGDKPELISRFQTQEYKFPIYSNGLNGNALYGYCKKAIITEPSITISARGTIGFTKIRNHSFTPIIRLIVVTPKNNQFIKFLELFLSQTSFENSGSVQKQLTIPQIENVKILTPNIKLINKFSDITTLSVGLIESNEKQNHQLTQLRDFLLPMLMNGQVSVAE